MSIAKLEQKENSCPGLQSADSEAGLARDKNPAQLKVAQCSVERWADVPFDILIQLMAWTSHIENSLVSTRSLGCVSKHFDAAIKAFQDIDLHRKTTTWVRSYLASPLNPNALTPLAELPDSRESLKAALVTAAKALSVPVRSCSPLWFEQMLEVPGHENWISECQAYGGQTLGIATFGGNGVGDLILQVERALPAGVSLNIHINQLSIALTKIDDAWLANFISSLCAAGRRTAFDFFNIEFADYPLARMALLDTLCDQGFVMSVSFAYMGARSVDCLLQDLADRFAQVSHVQFIGIAWPNQSACLSYAGLEGLQLAMERRRNAKSSRVNVAIDFKLWHHPNVEGKPLASEEKRRQMEGVGLYFGRAGRSAGHTDIVKRISESTGNDFWPKPVRVQQTDELSDSDSIIESSSDDEVGEVPDRSPSSVQGQREPSSRNTAATEPRVKKRDKCVIS